jgi:preprotein translocase subunit SecE
MARLQKKKSTQAGIKKRVKKTGDGAYQTKSGSNNKAVAAHTMADKALNRKITVRANKPVVAAKAPMAGQKVNWIQKSIQFLREVKVELKKVTWPSRKQTIGSTIVVLVLVVLISLFLGLVDMGLTTFVRVILQ